MADPVSDGAERGGGTVRRLGAARRLGRRRLGVTAVHGGIRRGPRRGGHDGRVRRRGSSPAARPPRARRASSRGGARRARTPPPRRAAPAAPPARRPAPPAAAGPRPARARRSPIAGARRARRHVAQREMRLGQAEVRVVALDDVGPVRDHVASGLRPLGGRGLEQDDRARRLSLGERLDAVAVRLVPLLRRRRPRQRRRERRGRTPSAAGASANSSRSRLRAELPKVMVHVEVAPAEPVGVGHPAEDRMRRPVEAPRRRR